MCCLLLTSKEGYICEDCFYAVILEKANTTVINNKSTVYYTIKNIINCYSVFETLIKKVIKLKFEKILFASPYAISPFLLDILFSVC